MRKSKQSLGILVLLCIFFLQCSDPKPASEKSVRVTDLPQDKEVFDGTGQNGGRLVLSITGNLESFNPITATTKNFSSAIKNQVFQNLVDIDLKTLGVKPKLARSMEILDNGKRIRLKLRRGVRWADGKPFTMADVKFTYNLVMDPKIQTRLKSYLQNTDGSFYKIDYTDDETIEFSTKDINPMFPLLIGIVYILPQHKWQKAYDENRFMQAMLVNSNPQDIIGTGPFRLDSYTPDERVVLKKNPYYWRVDKNGKRLPYLDKIVNLIVSDTNAELVKFLNGETDMYVVQPDQYDLVKRESQKQDYTLYDLGPSFKKIYLMVNQNSGKNQAGKPYLPEHKLKLFSDKRFRQALSYAMDRKSIVNTVWHGRGHELYSFSSPANKIWHNPNTKKYSYNLEKSKKLLQEIGAKDSNNDGLLEYPGTTIPIKLILKTNSESKERTQMANLLKDDFKKLGIDVRVQVLPFNSLVNIYKYTLDYDLVISGWSGAVPPDPSFSKNVLLSSGSSHYWNLNQKNGAATTWEKHIDELMTLNQSTIDQNKRIEYWHEIEKIWAEELPQIMISTSTTFVAIKNNIANTHIVNLRPYYDWNSDELYIKK